MAAMATTRDTFPLRFKDPRTREALKHLAEQSGTSMTEIAERAIEHEVALQGADLARRLGEALDVVRSYVPADDASAYIVAAAAGERSGLDPMRDIRAAHDPAPVPDLPDAYGVLAAFRIR